MGRRTRTSWGADGTTRSCMPSHDHHCISSPNHMLQLSRSVVLQRHIKTTCEKPNSQQLSWRRWRPIAQIGKCSLSSCTSSTTGGSWTRSNNPNKLHCWRTLRSGKGPIEHWYKIIYVTFFYIVVMQLVMTMRMQHFHIHIDHRYLKWIVFPFQFVLMAKKWLGSQIKDGIRKSHAKIKRSSSNSSCPARLLMRMRYDDVLDNLANFIVPLLCNYLASLIRRCLLWCQVSLIDLLFGFAI